MKLEKTRKASRKAKPASQQSSTSQMKAAPHQASTVKPVSTGKHSGSNK